MLRGQERRDEPPRLPAQARSCRRYLQRHTEKICRRILRIIDGETFSLEEMDECRIEIMHRYPQYEVPITVCTGLVFMAEAIRKSFGGKYVRYLRKYPIRLAVGTGKIFEIAPDDSLRHIPK